MKKDFEKFSINLESEEGLEEIMSFLRLQNVEFAPQFEKRIIRRLRLFTRREGLKNYKELLSRLENDKAVFEQFFKWLEKGRIYREEDKSYSPLVERKEKKNLVSDPLRMRMKVKQSELYERPLIPVVMLTDSPKDKKNLPQILEFLSKKKISYTAYKQNYFFRGLHARIMKTKTETYAEYRYCLQADSKEFDLLMASFSINVTRFFRDKELFSTLEKKVLIDLLKEKKNPVRIWSAGCCTGPEPYSLAMLIRGIEEKITIRKPLILATDVNMNFLREAKYGRYSSDYLKEVDQLKIQRYFKPIDEGNFQLVPEIRQMVTFQQHDLRTTPPANNFDLIMCRNVLIYFSRAQSDEFFKRFLSVLKPNGYLVLGKCEILPQSIKDNFDVIDTKNRIYKRKDNS